MIRSSFLACAALALLASAAHAAPITFGYTGTVLFVGAADPLAVDPTIFNDLIASPVTFSGQSTFDSAAPDVNALANTGTYFGSALTFNMATLVPVIAFNNPAITTENNIGGNDRYTVGGFEASATDSYQLSITLEDDDQGAFANDSLPILPPDLSLFEQRTVFFQYNDQDGNTLFDFGGRLDTLVCLNCAPAPIPEPAALSLLAGGVCVLVARRRRRR